MKAIGNKSIRLYLFICVLSCILFSGCASTSSLEAGSSISGSQIINAPMDIVYQEAINAAIDMQLLIASEDYDKKEIRLKSGSYTTGIFLCSGNLIGVFLSEEGENRVKVEIVEKLVLATQVLGCHDKAPQFMSRLISRVRQLQPQMARIEKCTGTGFNVSPHGLILTAYHLIEKAKSIKVHFLNGHVMEAKVSKVDPANDIAIISIEKETPDFLCFAPLRSCSIGESVFTLGFPVPSILGQDVKYTEGVISALSGLEGASSLLQITIPVQPGNSGGPVINEKGQVVGIITSTAAVKHFLRITGTIPQNINWAVKADYARLLFDVERCGPEIMSRNNVLENVKKSICLIEVNR